MGISGNYVFLSALLFSVIAASCENKADVIPVSDIQKFPSSSTINLNLVLNDSGLVQLEMKAPVLEQYENNDNPYSEFREGINVYFYDGMPEIQASVTSKYAKYLNNDKIWELRDSVEVIDNKGTKLETELLFWSQEKDMIYTDRFVKLTSPDYITTGMGFESDSHLRVKKIRKVWAYIYIGEETE